ncbi:MAG: selenocysteine-specific translation elongation factor, partial [Candidatus Marinimicrobia bacterium]|nr:selenocysteine-specific translation elongation factor [Candidatus Neomarinimicrobiota bacterium]
MQPVIWGTAGHIDHGKTALMKALTGTNTDRLTEEQERGLTIDIGFAFLTDEISFIDVPGHEKFVKNMVAGVSTIDAGLLVVAADDGVMPQTVEHLGILELLNIPIGCVALTKIDLVDPEWLALVEETIRESLEDTFLEGAKIIKTSAETGEGIDELKAHILDLSQAIPRRLNRGIPRLPVDRSFSIKGHGTVVTGSVLSGQFHSGDNVELMPGRVATKIRGVQSHGSEVKSVEIGDRAALNLSNIAVDEIQRGDQLTVPGMLQKTEELYASVTILDEPELELEQNQRVRLHLGTAEILARCTVLTGQKLSPGVSGLVKFRLEEPAVVAFADRFIIRFYSPMQTMGGGKVLFSRSLPSLKKVQLIEYLEGLDSPDLPAQILTLSRIHADRLLTAGDFSRELFYAEELLSDPLNTLVTDGELYSIVADGKTKYIHQESFNDHKNRLLEQLKEYHGSYPKEPGVSRSQLLQESALQEETFDLVIRELAASQSITEEGGLVRLPSHTIQLSEKEKETVNRLESQFLDAAFQPPTIKELQDEYDISDA